MTANAVLSSFPAPRRQPPAGVSAMVRLIRESFALVEPRAEEVAQFFYGMLFSLAPETRELFPINMGVQRSRLLRALVHVVQMVDRPDELVPYLQQLGRDHRKFGVLNSQYAAVGTALIGSIRKHAGEAWTPQVDAAWNEAYAVIAQTMRDAANADQGPAWWNAHVVDHERLAWDLAVVRVQPEYLVPYQPGQYVSVEVPQRPRLWRHYSPANAPREDGVMEFHVRAVDGGWVSRAIVGHTQLGDVWRIGSPMGRMRVNRESGRDLLMVAGGTGIAPVQAMLQDMTRWEENPRAHVFLGGRKAHDLYALESLRAMAEAHPWLTVVPVLEHEPEMTSVEHGTLVDVVTQYGSWEDREVVISGSPQMIRATVSRLLVAGTPLDRISYDPFSLE